ncbi:MAG: SpoIVB peptidase S55 domain protein [Selenomonadaceae bacterium]|nr:SpoIVB peptidase S55 domain protein [Selenomonadaceae bacterium]
MPEIMTLDQVQKGMHGLAYTVIDSSGAIESFDIEIIGLMNNGKGSNKMIMAKASGALIEKTGGVLQGMSGSPVYIDGKLVGALSAGLKEMSPYTFFITPIELMLPLWTLPDPKSDSKYQQLNTNNNNNNEIATTQDAENKQNASANDVPNFFNMDMQDIDRLNFESPTKMYTSYENQINRLFLDGFDSRGIQFLSQQFNGSKLYAADAADIESRIDYNAALEPGSPIGVAVVYGDFSVGATGTVTAVDGKKVLGFGHSFIHAGNSNFFMTNASIIGSVNGETGSGVKVANMGSIIGRINQDRDAGIAGIMGMFPSSIPIKVKVTDKSLGKTETYNATIAYNENLIPKLGASIAYTALSKTADSLAESTVDVTFDIKTNAVKSGSLKRQNVFYNSTDVGQVAVLELMQALNIVCSNTMVESDIFSIEVDMTIDNERRTASIVSVVPDKKVVKPGDTVNLTVTLQPYRKASETVVIPYTVPVTMREGLLTLDVHSGAVVPASQASGNSSVIISTDSNDVAKIYNDKINELINAGRNNQLVVEPNSTFEPKNNRELRQEIERIKKAKLKAAKLGIKPVANEAKVDIDYIIDNVVHTTITVEKL